MLSYMVRLTRRFEESEVPLSYFVASFLFWVFLRELIEGFVFQVELSHEVVIHFTLFYVALVLPLALVVALAAGRPPIKVLRVLFVGYVLVLLAPTLDLIIQHPITYRMAYLSVDTPGELLHAYLTYFGPLEAQGITPGMRIEIAIVLFATVFYVYAVTRSALRAALGLVGAWTVIFGICALQSIQPLVAGLLGFAYTDDLDVYVRSFAVIAALSALAIAALSDRKMFMAIFRDTRFLRVLHYELLFALGLAFAGPPSPFDFSRLLQLLLAAAAVWLGWVFAVMSNNVFDMDIDRINAPERPLVSGAIDPERYLRLSYWVLATALALAAAASFSTFWFVGLCAIAYFIYSAPPLRLKVKCSVSKAAIGINSAGCLLAGYRLWSPTLNTVPLAPLLLILFGFSLGAHVIDLKDVEGDRAAGIRNLPIMLGMDRARQVLAVGMLLAHAGLGFMLRDTWFGWAVLLGGVAQCYAILRHDYRDGLVLAVQDAVLACAVLFVAQGGPPG